MVQFFTAISLKQKMGKDISIWDWEEWVDFCLQLGEDPFKISDIGFDEGGGDSRTVYYKGSYPKKEKDSTST